jgi:hypothetical protein
MHDQNPSVRSYVSRSILFAVATSAIAISVGSALGSVFTQSDVNWYLRISNGQTADVMQPFASRQLGPLLVHLIGRLLHISIYSGFLIEGVFSIFIATAIVGFLLTQSAVDAITLTAVGGTLFWSELFNGLALPDLWFSALLAVFLLLLHREKFLLASVLLLPLFVSRESTILVLAALLAAGWGMLRLRVVLTAVLASLSGIVIVRTIIPHGLANREHMGVFTYMAGKVPWNLMRNVLGFPMWNDRNTGNCATPRWRFPIHLGSMHAVGVCSYTPELPLWTIRLALSSFGLFPLIFIFLCLRRPASLWPRNLLLRFCLFYGAASFFLAPGMGASIPRLFGYAWPLFLLAVPILASIELSMKRGPLLALLGLHLAVSWSAVVNRFQRMKPEAGLLFLLALACAYVIGWLLLCKAEMKHNSVPVIRD